MCWYLRVGSDELTLGNFRMWCFTENPKHMQAYVWNMLLTKLDYSCHSMLILWQNECIILNVFRTQQKSASVIHHFENVAQVEQHLALQWRHNERDCVSNHQPHEYLLKRLFRRRSKKSSKLRVTGLCAGISPVTGEFPAQRASNAENVSIWSRHHDFVITHTHIYTHMYIYIYTYMYIDLPCVYVVLNLYAVARIPVIYANSHWR